MDGQRPAAHPASEMQPGDLLFFDGIGQVSMYVGSGCMIDAARRPDGPVNSPWYAQAFVGVARP